MVLFGGRSALRLAAHGAKLAPGALAALAVDGG